MVQAGFVRELLSADGRRDPFTHYARLRAEGPVTPLDGTGGYQFLVSGYDAANQALRDPALRVEDAGYLDDRDGHHWRRHPVLLRLFNSVFCTNGADHARVRPLLTRVLTPRRVLQLEPAIGELTDALLDGMAELGADGSPVDFMSEFAYPLPSNVIGELLGIPEADRAWFRPRVRAIGEMIELDGRTWKLVRAADRATEEISGYLTDLIAQRRAEPREDLVSALIQVQQEDPTRISDEELLSNLLTVYNAGFVTTTHMFGHALIRALREPRWQEPLRTDDAFVPGYVEGVLRTEPTTQLVVRWAAEDTEVAGAQVTKGDRVLVALAAANRDPQRYPDPDTFDPTRPDIAPLTFSAGPHYCLGAALTRAEGRIALPMLMRRFPRMALAAEPATPHQLVLRGYEQLYVTIG
ncbi:MAG TPA: cytochrome P450 [Micromonospora sp.]